jgi:hypothetical protein
MQDDKCPCCLDDDFTSRLSAKLDPCGHQFHADCIERWRAQPGREFSCPVCRRKEVCIVTENPNTPEKFSSALRHIIDEERNRLAGMECKKLEAYAYRAQVSRECLIRYELLGRQRAGLARRDVELREHRRHLDRLHALKNSSKAIAAVLPKDKRLLEDLLHREITAKRECRDKMMRLEHDTKIVKEQLRALESL